MGVACGRWCRRVLGDRRRPARSPGGGAQWRRWPRCAGKALAPAAAAVLAPGTQGHRGSGARGCCRRAAAGWRCLGLLLRQLFGAVARQKSIPRGLPRGELGKVAVPLLEVSAGRAARLGSGGAQHQVALRCAVAASRARGRGALGNVCGPSRAAPWPRGAFRAARRRTTGQATRASSAFAPDRASSRHSRASWRTRCVGSTSSFAGAVGLDRPLAERCAGLGAAAGGRRLGRRRPAGGTAGRRARAADGHPAAPGQPGLEAPDRRHVRALRPAEARQG